MLVSEAIGPELVIGLVGPIGTDLPAVGKAVADVLNEVGYQPIPIKLSKAMCDYKEVNYPEHQPADERYEFLMALGTDVRTDLNRGDALALLAVLRIRRERKLITGKAAVPAIRRAYILDSLKNPAEARTLREIYGDSFFLLAAYSPRAARVQRLAGLIAESRHGARAEEHRAGAEKLVAKDEHERDSFNRGIDLGQNVQDVFPLADAFVDACSPSAIRDSVFRSIRLLFAHPFHTPTRDEQGMFFAKAAALRSASLARQVGAVISSPEGEIRCVGTNEVPKAGGGLYWEGDVPDDRDFVLGRDTSDDHRKRLAADILKNLQEANWLTTAKSAATIDELTTLALAAGIEKGPLRRARLMDLLEFVRAVHAEMAALTEAARRGIPVLGDTMYVTTFPCHECARLIVAAGINRVVYIEPYPKSLAAELYPSSIQVESGACGNKVHFEPFIGIAPRRYADLFEMREDRKDKRGQVISWVPTNAQPRVSARKPVHPLLETDFVTLLEQAMDAAVIQKTLDFDQSGGDVKDRTGAENEH